MTDAGRNAAVSFGDGHHPQTWPKAQALTGCGGRPKRAWPSRKWPRAPERGRNRYLLRRRMPFPRISGSTDTDQNTHGTGCTYSAALACSLTRNKPLETAVAEAKEFMTQAIRQAFSIGAGHSPVNHFCRYRYWSGKQTR